MEQQYPSQRVYPARPPFRKLMKAAGFLVIGFAALGMILVVAFSFLSGIPLYSPPHSPSSDGITSSIDQFKYQPERIQTGVVYHYIKSNIDGSKPVKIALYVASNERIEAFKLNPQADAPDLVIAQMDWNLFSPDLIESYRVPPDGSYRLVANMRLEPGNRYQVYFADFLWVKRATSSAPVGHFPVHNYNFDLASLNFAFRHLVDPTQDFEIGVQMPWFDMMHLGKVEYLGKATIYYLGEEACHATRCRKYRIGGDAFDGQQGFLWINREGGYFEKVEIPVRDNLAWKDFKLELIGIDYMDQNEWKQYIQTRTGGFYDSLDKNP